MRELQVLSAFDQVPIASLAMHEEAYCQDVLERSHRLYLDRDVWLPKTKRLAILGRAAELVERRADELATQAAREGGKPLVDSRAELARASQGIRAAAYELHKLGGEEIPMGLTASSENRIAYTWREPRGVVLSISAFNHPFNLIVHQVIPAVAVGCPVVVKPAMTTPLSCKALVEILYESGLPEAWCRMVLCEDEVAENMVADERTSFLSFIGSAKVGWHLRSRLAPGATCALEHGGLAPAIVDASANLAHAIPLLVKGGFYHAGQVCVSVQRIYVHESIIDGFLRSFVSRVKKLRVGDPVRPDTEVGPLILPREVDRVHSWVREAIDGGAQLLCGGQRTSDTCYLPTVLKDPPADARVSREEIFGPVVAVYGYRDLDDAIAQANAVDAYFQASLFTGDADTALRSHRRLNGMAVMVNDHTAFRVDWMPFGGHRASGLGVGGIGYSMHDMTIERLVVFRTEDHVTQ